MTTAFLYFGKVHGCYYPGGNSKEETPLIYIPLHEVIAHPRGSCFKCEASPIEKIENVIAIHFPVELAKKVAFVASLQIEYDRVLNKDMKLGESHSFVELRKTESELKPELENFWNTL
jgi:hypothetical protein